MSFITENEIITKIIRDGAATAMSLEKIISLEVSEWKTSPKRELMLKGEQYYRNKTDILNRERTVIGSSGAREEVQNLANNKLVNGFFRKLVDQKVGYLLSKPMSIQVANDKTEYQKLLASFFGKAMLRMLQNIGKESIKKGIAWLHVYYSEDGKLSFMQIPSEQIIPLWRDAAHTDLQAVIRYYEVEAFEGTTKRIIQKVEWWDTKGVRRYVFQAGGQHGLVPDVEAGDTGSHFKIFNIEKGDDEQPANWERVPFIAFKYNEEEQSLLELIKTLVDDYDARKSDNANNLEDLPNSIYVVKDYDGTDAAEFRKNISIFRVVFTEGEGDVGTISLEINTEAYKVHMEQNRKDIYEFGRGVDTESDKLGNSPSGISLEFLYADLDMDCNMIETEFQASLEQLRWFIDVHIANTSGADYSAESIDFIFNRDILINETDTINNAKNSEGVISKKTIVANHPWVVDVEEELTQIEKEQQEDLERFQDYSGLGGNLDGGGDGSAGKGSGSQNQ